MNINQCYSGDFLKSADIKGKRISVIMDKVTMEKIGDDGDKPVLYFVGKNKGLVLNKTNSGMIAYQYGDETNNWIGKQIRLHVEPVPFGGQIVDAIRVSPPPQAAQADPGMAAQQPALQPSTTTEASREILHNYETKPAEQLDDDIPF